MRFTSIELQNWRNFRQAGPVALQQRMFVIGPNACGKSNFLDAFRFLHDVAKPGGGLRHAVDESGRGGVSRIRCLAAGQKPEVAIEVTAQDDGGARWTYRLAFGQDSAKTPRVRQEVLKKGGQVILDRPDSEDEADPERLGQTHLEQVTANKEFRGFVTALSETRYLHIVPQLVREPDRSIGRTQDPYGGDFLEQVARAPGKTRDSRLRRMGEALKIAVPQFSVLELERDPGTGVPHLRAKYEHWRRRGAWQSETDFSDGTLRLLGLLWAAMDGNGLLLLEEPELSLSPAIVRQVPSLFSKVLRSRKMRVRQYIVSTHAWDMLRDEGVAPDEVLVLTPAARGTEIRLARDIEGVTDLAATGLSVGEALGAIAEPDDPARFLEFGA